jgi:hypothetical protein
LLKLSIDVCQATVANTWDARVGPPSQTWRTFLRNHIGQIVGPTSSRSRLRPTASQSLQCHRVRHGIRLGGIGGARDGFGDGQASYRFLPAFRPVPSLWPPLATFCLAQRARCAAEIFARAAALILRRFRGRSSVAAARTARRPRLTISRAPLRRSGNCRTRDASSS